MFKMSALKMIRFYQHFLSVLKPRCCRFHPSCSQFAYVNFEKNGFFAAFWASLLRLMKCNPYFKGGFDYPKICRKKLQLTKKPLSKKLLQTQLKFLYVPCDKKRYYIVKIVF